MKTVKSFNKQNGTTYVYEILDSYYDKEKKTSVAKRRLIGKIDPQTGEMVPTRPRGQAKPSQPTDSSNYEALYHQAQRKLDAKEKELDKLRTKPSQPTDSSNYEALYHQAQRKLDAKEKELDKLRTDITEVLDSLTVSLGEIEQSAKTAKIKMEMLKKRIS